MRRLGVVLLAVTMLCGVFAIGGRYVVAQDATPAAADHPFVGSWIIDTEPENPNDPLHISTATADGGYVEVEPQATSVGAWEATGDNTVTLNIHFLLGPQGGMGTIRANIEVAPDGQSFTGTYTVELAGPDGSSPGEAGPNTVEGGRMTVEPPGTPVGSFEEVFGGQPGGTPEATPAS